MNCWSLWSDCLRAQCILCPLYSWVPFFFILSSSLLSPQASLLKHPDSPVILCEPPRIHSHFSHSKYSSFDSPGYICDPPSIFTFMTLGYWLFIGNWSLEAISFLESTYVMRLTLVTGIKPTVPLSAIDKENSLEFSLHWSVYLYIIHLVCALIIPHSQPNYVWHVLWHDCDLWCDPVTHYVTWCNRLSHAINRKVK